MILSFNNNTEWLRYSSIYPYVRNLWNYMAPCLLYRQSNSSSAASTVKLISWFISKGQFAFYLKVKYQLLEKYKQGYRKVSSCRPHTVYKWRLPPIQVSVLLLPVQMPPTAKRIMFCESCSVLSRQWSRGVSFRHIKINENKIQTTTLFDIDAASPHVERMRHSLHTPC